MVRLAARIKLQQGVPQGDVVSPYIFLLLEEILLLKITKKHLNGVDYAQSEERASGFADDCTFFLKKSEGNLSTVVKILLGNLGPQVQQLKNKSYTSRCLYRGGSGHRQ